MSDYISREEAISIFSDIHPLDHNANAYKYQIEKLQPADVRENIHGVWKLKEHGNDIWFECNKCRKETDFMIPAPNYCSNCGADMRGEV